MTVPKEVCSRNGDNEGLLVILLAGFGGSTPIQRALVNWLPQYRISITSSSTSKIKIVELVLDQIRLRDLFSVSLLTMRKQESQILMNSGCMEGSHQDGQFHSNELVLG